MFNSIPYFIFCSRNLCLWSIFSVYVGLAKSFGPYVVETTSRRLFSGHNSSAAPFEANACHLTDPSIGGETYLSIYASDAAVPRHVYASDAFSLYYCPDFDCVSASL